MANKVQINPETPLVFLNEAAGAPGVGTRVDFNVDALPFGSGHLSGRYDLGVGPRTYRYEWRGSAIPAGNVPAGSGVDMYLVTSDGTYPDGNFGTGVLSVTNVEKKRNLQYCGSLVNDKTNTTEPMQAAGVVEIYSRYIQVVWFNATSGVALSGTAGNSRMILTPIPPEIQ